MASKATTHFSINSGSVELHQLSERKRSEIERRVDKFAQEKKQGLILTPNEHTALVIAGSVAVAVITVAALASSVAAFPLTVIAVAIVALGVFIAYKARQKVTAEIKNQVDTEQSKLVGAAKKESADQARRQAQQKAQASVRLKTLRQQTEETQAKQKVLIDMVRAGKDRSKEALLKALQKWRGIKMPLGENTSREIFREDCDAVFPELSNSKGLFTDLDVLCIAVHYCNHDWSKVGESPARLFTLNSSDDDKRLIATQVELALWSKQELTAETLKRIAI